MTLHVRPEVTQALIILRDPENATMALGSRLSPQFPQVHFVSVDHPDAAGAYLDDVEVLITLGAHLGPAAQDVFGRARKLRWVQVIGAGVDNVLHHPALSADAAVTNITGIHGPQMSEAAFTAMLGFARDVRRTMRNQEAARWERFPARLLSGKTVGVVGIGAIAAALAPRCQAFGMRVEGFSATAREVAGFDAVYSRRDLEARVGGIDYLVLLTPPTSQTRRLVGPDLLAAMSPGAVLINLARGGLVDEAALLAALRAGRIRGAALDVFETEPLPADHPFWSMPNVMVTPHLGGFHEGYADAVLVGIADNLRRYLDGGAAALCNRVA